jgi:hypothetical protein
MTQSELIQFFADRPSINLKSFATECGLSQSLLWMIVNDKRTLQPNQIEMILPIAVRYGFSK